MLDQKFGKLRGFLVTVKAVIDYINQSRRKGGNKENFSRKMTHSINTLDQNFKNIFRRKFYNL